jgi:thiamine-phosphate pyrophosphorylase
LDAALVSAAFHSRSVSAKGVLGPVRLARLVQSARLPVIALGGVNARTAPRLLGAGVAGLAAIDGFVAAPKSR